MEEFRVWRQGGRFQDILPLIPQRNPTCFNRQIWGQLTQVDENGQDGSWDPGCNRSED